MQKKNSQNDISALLRSKYINTSIDESLKLNSHYPRFTELGGMKYLHKPVIDFVYNPLFKKDDYKNMGVFPPSTLLFHGVGGVGKSFLINCISQEYKIPIIHGNYDSDREIREVFRKAEAKENSIVLFDKIDLINEENDMKVITQLAESLNNHRSRSIVIATAENPLNIHPSLRSFDNEILIKIPNIIERTEMCETLLKNVNHSIEKLDDIARITPGFVPRDLKRMIKLAASISLSKGRIKIILDDFKEAIDQMKKVNNIITFDNIGALQDVKDELCMSIILPSRYPDKFKRLGIVKPSGILLHGPPGCGKTLLARAVSNMSHCNFISVKGPELISKYVGDSEKEIRKLFDKAKQLQPCVVFFDEIDSLCSKRKGNEFGNRIVNQILTLLDGLDDRGEVYMIGATNRLSSIDEALLRPGRFDKIIEVPLPENSGCVDIFLKCTKGLPVEQFEPTDLELGGLSGADIAGIVKEAAIFCLKDDFDSEDAVITKQNFIDSINKYRRMKNQS
ncbi:Cell division cycle protein 48 like protein [Nosema granulosis]|uniref:Cell division cycle protein 48 like protein n=1 Tax=Nosema granulosis TaxID=83296 RepID=A0A9P6KYN5_9MICR|nr:Cell division cycle protein 48 like protein [Nosema granulosis]